MSGADSTKKLPLLRTLRRQRIFLIIAVATAFLSLAGLAVSLGVKSPAQQAVDQAAPAATVMTVAIEKKVLKSTVVLRGTVTAASSVDVVAAVTAAGSAPVITALPKAVGAAVNAGDVVAQISGRPIIALPGSTPAYRDLKPGSTGSDVVQLQRALSALNYLPRSADDGIFASATKRALVALFKDKGFEATTTSDVNTGESAAVEAAQLSVKQSQRKLDTDTLTMSWTSDPTQSALLEQQLAFDREDVAASQAALKNLAATTGAQLPMAEVVFVPSLPATVGSISSAVGAAVSSANGTIMTLNEGSLAVSAVVPAGSQAGIATAQSVVIADDVNQRDATGTLTSLGTFTSGVGSTANGSSTQTGAATQTGTAAQAGAASQQAGYPITVTPSTPLDSSWLARNVRITIAMKTTSDAVLVAPVAAIRSTANSTTYVIVRDAKGTQSKVTVTTGVIAGGEIEVVPVNVADLFVGCLLVVG